MVAKRTRLHHVEVVEVETLQNDLGRKTNPEDAWVIAAQKTSSKMCGVVDRKLETLFYNPLILKRFFQHQRMQTMHFVRLWDPALYKS